MTIVDGYNRTYVLQGLSWDLPPARTTLPEAAVATDEKRLMQGEERVRDAMLSHSKLDIDIVTTFDLELRAATCGDRPVSIWLDDREIEGGSVVAAINEGLETSRHVVLCLTPNYFTSRSGWTYAEWMAGLYDDPAGRMDRVIPVMFANVKLPALLRHLDTIDLRPPKNARRPHELEFARLIRRICAQGRSSAATGGREDQRTIERAISIPGPIRYPRRSSRICCRRSVFRTRLWLQTSRHVSTAVPSRSRSSRPSLGYRDLVIEATRLAGRRFPPAFRRVRDELVSFSSPAVDRIFATVADARSSHYEPLRTWTDDPDGQRVVVSLLNAAVRDRAAELHLVRHRRHPQRFYFERPLDASDLRIQWRGKGKPLTVTRALLSKTGAVRYWLHRAIEANVEFYEGVPYLQLHPTIVLTVDGTSARVLGGPVVAEYARAYVSRERNGHLHRHVLYWISVFSDGTEAVQLPLGAGTVIFDTRPAEALLPVGIGHDQVKIKGANLQDAFIETRVGDENADEEEEPVEGLDELTEFAEEDAPGPPADRRASTEVRNRHR